MLVFRKILLSHEMDGPIFFCGSFVDNRQSSREIQICFFWLYHALGFQIKLNVASPLSGFPLLLCNLMR